MDESELLAVLGPWYDTVLGRLVDNRASEARTKWITHMRREFPALSNGEFEEMLNRGARLLTFELWRMGVTAALGAGDELPAEFLPS